MFRRQSYDSRTRRKTHRVAQTSRGCVPIVCLLHRRRRSSSGLRSTFRNCDGGDRMPLHLVGYAGWHPSLRKGEPWRRAMARHLLLHRAPGPDRERVRPQNLTSSSIAIPRAPHRRLCAGSRYRASVERGQRGVAQRRGAEQGPFPLPRLVLPRQQLHRRQLCRPAGEEMQTSCRAHLVCHGETGCKRRRILVPGPEDE